MDATYTFHWLVFLLTQSENHVMIKYHTRAKASRKKLYEISGEIKTQQVSVALQIETAFVCVCGGAFKERKNES